MSLFYVAVLGLLLDLSRRRGNPVEAAVTTVLKAVPGESLQERRLALVGYM